MTTTSAYDPGGRPRRLQRSRRDRWLGGVCGGMGEYLGIDPVIVRLVAIALVFAGGVGVVAYVAALLLVPDEGNERPIVRTGLADGGSDRPWVIAGAVLLGIGAIAFVDAIDFGWGADVLWSLVLLAGGAYLLLRYTGLGRSLGLDLGPVRPPRGAAGTPNAPTGWSGATAATSTVEAPPPDAPTESSEVSTVTSTTEIPSPIAPAESTEASPPPNAGLPSGPTEPLPPVPPPRRRRRPRATRVALGAVLLIVGLGGVLLGAGAFDLATETFVAASVIVIGAALVAGAWWGGSPTLVGIGLATAAVLGLVMAVDVDLDGGVGDRLYRPAGAASLQDRYRLGMGRLWVDLRSTELPQGTTRVDTSLGVGELTVVVPDGVRVEASGSAGVGDLRILGRQEDGSDAEQTVTDAGALAAPGRRVLVDAEVGVGEIRVYRASDAPSPERFDRDRGRDRGGPPFGTAWTTTGGLPRGS